MTMLLMLFLLVRMLGGGGGKAWGYFSQVRWCVQRIGLQDAVLNIFKKSELTSTKLKAKQQQMGTAAQSKLI